MGGKSFMSMPELIFDNENHFIDITNDDVRIRFANTEEIEGHMFRHVAFGVFAAEPAFEISNSDMYDMVIKYRDVVYVVENINESERDDDRKYKVVFAYSENSVSNRFAKLNYLNNACSNNSVFKKYYDFRKRLDCISYDFYRTANIDYDNLPVNNIAFEPIYNKIVLPNGRRPWIKLNNHIGIEVEEGIYYFARSGDSIGNRLIELPVVALNTVFSNEYVAAICHPVDIHLSMESAVEYIAVGKEHFSRLKEIRRIVDNGFYHEYGNCDSKIKDKSVIIPVVDTTIPDAAEELIKELGFFNICVSFERPFIGSSGFCEYDIAYKLENNLVLGIKKGEKVTFEYHDLRFLSALYVKQNKRLNNGIDYPVIHKVIDCGDERLKEILTPEAYSIYVNEINQ